MPTPLLTVLLFATLAPGQDPERITWSRLARRLDADGDGQVTRDEFPRRPALFRRLDRDGDGVLTADDFERSEDAAPAQAEAPADPAGLALYESEVQGILEAACYKCHAATSRKLRGELRVDSRTALLRGGVSGPALVPGDSQASLLMEAVRWEDDELAMPPDEPLEPAQVEALAQWIALGAPFTGEQASEDLPAHGIDIEAGREWWSFQPVERPAVPAPADADWAWTESDAFLRVGMEAAGVAPVGDADRRDWLRRVTFDLTGLPPTSAELESFLSDRSDQAHERVVDRLLASERYGERWGRHWLDVARYAESSGRDSNVIYPHAWRYRDWVIEAFDRDLPYDQFLIEQLAGDLLPSEGAGVDARRTIATGYLALGPKSHNTRNPVQFAADVVDEQIDAISQGMLGITLACARCHDHKFDPIPTEDYYALAGILQSTETCFGTFRGPGLPRTADLLELPSGADLPNGADMPAPLRRILERRRSAVTENTERSMNVEGELDQVERLRLRFAQDALVSIEDLLSRFDSDGQALPSNRLAMGVREARTKEARVLARGEIDGAGERVARGFPQVLCAEGSPRLPRRSSGRLELAQWIASPDNPLTARVWVNRVWSHLFGRGLVPTPNNFGQSGQGPTHPQLLDWLAAEFMADGWSTQALVRELVLSHAYRLDTAEHEKHAAIDPESSLLWRMPPRRLEAEAMRDAILFSAGALELERPIGSRVGALEGAPRREDLIDLLTEGQRVRSVYLPSLRDKVPRSLECFDAADPSFVTGQREETTVATQALYLMNDEDVIDAADLFARRLLREEDTDTERIGRAFELALSRRPSKSEVTAVRRFLRDFEGIVKKDGIEFSGRDRRRRGFSPEQAAWSAFAQSLFQCAEFRYRG